MDQQDYQYQQYMLQLQHQQHQQEQQKRLQQQQQQQQKAEAAPSTREFTVVALGRSGEGTYNNRKNPAAKTKERGRRGSSVVAVLSVYLPDTLSHLFTYGTLFFFLFLPFFLIMVMDCLGHG